MNKEIVIGWTYSYLCSLVDKGIDIRKVEVPSILEEANNSLVDIEQSEDLDRVKEN